MKNKILIVALWIAWLNMVIMITMTGTQNLNGQSASPSLDFLVEQYFNNYLEKPHTYGLAIGILDGKDTHHFYYGNQSDSNIQAPQDATLFELGGLSKVFTAALFMDLVEKGILEKDASVYSFLPDSIKEKTLSNASFLKEITLHHLATHTAALTKKPGNMLAYKTDQENPYAQYNRFALLEWIQKLKPDPSVQVGEYKFSHLSFAILGLLMELKTQQTYAQLLKEYLPEKIEIELNENIQNHPQLIQGHQFNGSPNSHQQFGAMAPSLGLTTTLPQLSLFIRLNMEAGTDSIPSTSIHASLKACQESQNKSHQKRVDTGYGWHLAKRRKKDPLVYTHSGSTNGARCFVAFIKESQTAVIVLGNSTEHFDEIGFELLYLLNR